MGKPKYPRLSFEQIEKVVAGDTEAMNALVTLYMPYINTLSHGNKETEDMVIARLMNAAMRFKLDYERPLYAKAIHTGKIIAKTAPKQHRKL